MRILNCASGRSLRDAYPAMLFTDQEAETLKRPRTCAIPQRTDSGIKTGPPNPSSFSLSAPIFLPAFGSRCGKKAGEGSDDSCTPAARLELSWAKRDRCRRIRVLTLWPHPAWLEEDDGIVEGCYHTQVVFRGLRWVSRGPISSKLPNPVLEPPGPPCGRERNGH